MNFYLVARSYWVLVVSIKSLNIISLVALGAGLKVAIFKAVCFSRSLGLQLLAMSFCQKMTRSMQVHQRKIRHFLCKNLCVYTTQTRILKKIKICTLLCPLQTADFSSTYLKLRHCIDIDDITYIGSFLIKFCGLCILFRRKSKFLKVLLGS